MYPLESAIYYTFSTIPQVLAGAIGLLAAFVLYRLQKLTREMDRAIYVPVQFYEGKIHSELNSMYIQNKRKELLAFFKKNKKKANIRTETKSGIFDLHILRVEYLLDYKRRLLRDLKISLLLTAGLIVSSLVVLTVTPFLEDIEVYVFTIGIIWLLLCHLSYINIVIKSL
jgi:hypothetical protein